MPPETAEHEIRSRLEIVSGRPVLQRAQAPAQGYALLRLADATAPAHLLSYRPELAADLPYLVAFQYGLALRTLKAAPDRRFDLGPTPAMATAVWQLITDHLQQSQSSLPASVIPELSQQLGSGRGAGAGEREDR